MSELVRLDREVVLAEHLVAHLAEVDEKPCAESRRLRDELFLIEIPSRAIPIGCVRRGRAESREGRLVVRIEVEGSLEVLLRRHAIAELLVELLTDAVVHLDLLPPVRGELRDARH